MSGNNHGAPLLALVPIGVLIGFLVANFLDRRYSDAIAVGSAIAIAAALSAVLRPTIAGGVAGGVGGLVGALLMKTGVLFGLINSAANAIGLKNLMGS